MSACPPWCDQGHGPTSGTHTADCGGVSLDSAAFQVTLARYGRAATVVELDVVLGSDATVVTFTPAEATVLLAALAEALDRAGAS